MTDTRTLQCACGKVRLELQGSHIAGVECCCNSCRRAGDRLQKLPDAPAFMTEYGATRYELWRKDRVNFIGGAEQLKAFRLRPGSRTRRVVATCCNTPIFTEFEAGHWLSLYGHLWPAGSLPKAEFRTMTGDLDDPSGLPDDVPPLTRYSVGFFAKLFGSWAAMGFRNRKIPVNGTIEV